MHIPQRDTFLAHFGQVAGVEQDEITLQCALLEHYEARYTSNIVEDTDVEYPYVPLLYRTSSYGAPKIILFCDIVKWYSSTEKRL